MAGRLTCCERLWSVKVEERSEIGNWMLLDTRDNDPPSLCGRLLCFCAPTYPRVPNAIKDIPEISMLAGAMLEDDWGLKGSVYTNRYMDFDKLNRVGNIKVFGGAEICNNCCASCGGHYQVAQWSAGDTSCVRYPLSVFGRCANYGYRYTFSSDWRKADIAITLNLCFCIPWLPAWFTVPSCLVKFDMVQTEESTDGRAWTRRGALCPLCCGYSMRREYGLDCVVNPDGSPGPAHAKLMRDETQIRLLTTR